jgi:hypothetical protein
VGRVAFPAIPQWGRFGFAEAVTGRFPVTLLFIEACCISRNTQVVAKLIGMVSDQIEE